MFEKSFSDFSCNYCKKEDVASALYKLGNLKVKSTLYPKTDGSFTMQETALQARICYVFVSQLRNGFEFFVSCCSCVASCLGYRILCVNGTLTLKLK